MGSLSYRVAVIWLLVTIGVISANASMGSGDAVVSGFSGTVTRGGQLFIDTDSPSVKIFDLKKRGAAQAQLLDPPVRMEIKAKDIGQIFAISLDDATPPNIYLGATSIYGIHIVKPDANGDSIPEVSRTGDPTASFMDGMYGPGGSAGSVWKVDGKSGTVTLFADLKNANVPNGGAGLGDIAFDPEHYQLFVSDLDSGMIHRLDMNGNILGLYDHGVDGRAVAGLTPVPDDGVTADIGSPSFDSQDPATWGYTPMARRVWALSYYKERLYYAVEDGPSIWSVGFNMDGTFASDARVEIPTVPGGFPVSDILFTPSGEMVLAQRGGIVSDGRFERFHIPGKNRVVIYRKDTNGVWVSVPDEYAIGFPPDYQNASGGIALGCDDILWSTGDNLRDDPVLSGYGALEVHGLQGNDISLVKPRNILPWSTWFVDFDGVFGDSQKSGHVGDVEIYRYCLDKKGKYDISESWPGWTPPVAGWTPPNGWLPPPWWIDDPDLSIYKEDTQCSLDTMNPGFLICTFTISVTDVGGGTYNGFLNIVENVPMGALFMPPAGGSVAWNCSQPAGAGTVVYCDSVSTVTMIPGTSETLDITLQIPAPGPGMVVDNCAGIEIPGNPILNDSDCSLGYQPGPDLESDKSLDFCTFAPGGAVCNYWLDINNVGNRPHTGWLHLVDTLPAGSIYLGVTASSDPAWSCVDFGNSVECWLPPVTLPPFFGNEWVEISVFIPDGTPPGESNCMDLGIPEHLNDPNINGNNRDCAPVIAPIRGPILFYRGSEKVCPDGWNAQSPKWVAPKGWEMKTVKKDGRSYLCGRKKPKIPPKCPEGWSQYGDTSSVPAGWDSKKIEKDGMSVICAKEPPKRPVCPDGWYEYPDSKLVPPNWKIERIDGERESVICAKAPDIPPPPPPPPSKHTTSPHCESGESLYGDISLIPAGWSYREIHSDGSTLWCARPGSSGIVVCPPGTYLYAGVCIPYSDTISHCPAGMHLYHGRCIGNGIVRHCPPGMYMYHGRCISNITVEHCPHGTHLYHGICVTNDRDRYCPPGTHLYHGRCIENIRGCPHGMHKEHGRCVYNHSSHNCPRGYHRRHGRCVPDHDVGHRCPRGSHLYHGRCIPDHSGYGSHGHGDRHCPQGYKRKHGRCVPKHGSHGNSHRCPRGSHSYHGRCIPDHSGYGSHGE